MSLREKAQEVKAAGEAQRGNWEPPEFSKKVYRYWAERSNNVPAGRENLCHFGRVFFIWAPLMVLRRGVRSVFENEYVQATSLVLLAVALLAAIVLGAFTSTEFLAVLAGIGVVAYSLIGVFTGTMLGNPTERAGMYENEVKWFKIVAGLTFPLSIPTYLVVHNFMKLSKSTRESVGVYSVLGVAGLAILGAAVLAVVELGKWGIALVVGLPLLGLAGYLLLPLLADWISGLRATMEVRSERKRREWLDSEPTPERTPTRFENWLGNAFDAVGDFLRAIGRGIGDVVIFAAQFTRAKKLKICPFVDIDEPAQNREGELTAA